MRSDYIILTTILIIHYFLNIIYISVFIYFNQYEENWLRPAFKISFHIVRTRSISPVIMASKSAHHKSNSQFGSPE